MPLLFSTLARLAPFAFLLSLAACTSQVVEAPPADPAPSCEDGQQNGSETGLDCGGESCAPCPTLIECDVACATTSEEGCFDTATCKQTCESLALGTSAAAAEAFERCAAENPLCFQTIEDCMLAELYPDPVVQQATLSASGFEAYEGRTVVIALQKPGGEMAFAPPQTVQGGAFSVTWSVEMSIGGSGLMLYYVDADENGNCSLPADLAHSTFAERSPGFDIPSWTATVTPPVNPEAFGFVCAEL
jgi:hypothetical protein